MKEETERQERVMGCGAGPRGGSAWGWGGGGVDGENMCIPICVCLVGLLDLLQDYVTPVETLSPGTYILTGLGFQDLRQESIRRRGVEGRSGIWGWRRWGGGEGASEQCRAGGNGQHPPAKRGRN